MNQLFTPSPRQRSTIPNEIAREIQRNIANGDLKGGDKLPSVDAMATDLKVSRASVREALHGLEALGLIEIQHGRGSFVTHEADRRLSTARWVEEQQYQLLELCELRLAVETAAARLAATKASEAEIDAIEEANNRFRDSVGGSDERVRWDTEFHFRIFDAAKNRLLRASLEMSLEYLTEARRRMPILEAAGGTTSQHDAVVQAIRARDPEAATQAMRVHLKHVEQGLGINTP